MNRPSRHPSARTVVHYTDAVQYGGAERMLVTLAGGLTEHGWRPVIVYHSAPEVDRIAAEARELGIEVLPLPASERPMGVRVLLPLMGALRRVRPKVFHAHLAWPLRCTVGLVASLLARVPHRVVTQQLFVPPRTGRKLRRQRAIARIVDRYLAVSRAMAVQLAEALGSDRNVSVVYNGIDPALLERPRDALLRYTLTGGTERPVVLALTRLERQKGLDTLISAAELLPDALFIVAGDGSERTRLEAEVADRQLSSRFRFIGYRADVPDLLAASETLVLPSRFEGLPVSVLEAMAAGLPVVATRVAGTDEAVVHGETGLLVPPEDPVALAEALRRVLAGPEPSRRFGALGRARVERKFGARGMAAAVARIYDDVAGPARTGAARTSGRSSRLDSYLTYH